MSKEQAHYAPELDRPAAMIEPVMHGEPEALASLFAKLAKAVASVEALERNGVNSYHHYTYATDADVLTAARKALSDAGLAFFPSLHRAERMDSTTRNGTPQTKTYLDFHMVIGDGETGATISCGWAGEAFDTDDKGTSKAATSAVKYFLLKLLMIPVPDSDDADRSSPNSPHSGGNRTRSLGSGGARRQPARPARTQTPQAAADGNGNPTAFWSAVNPLIGTGKRFATKDQVNAWLAAFTTDQGTDWTKALAALDAPPAA